MINKRSVNAQRKAVKDQREVGECATKGSEWATNGANSPETRRELQRLKQLVVDEHQLPVRPAARGAGCIRIGTPAA